MPEPLLVEVDHDPFRTDISQPQNTYDTAISAQDPVFDALNTGANIQRERFAAPQQTPEGYPYYQTNEVAPYNPPAAQGPETPLAAYEYAPELADPRVRNRLLSYTAAEVGRQGPEAAQSFIEETIRRAKIEGKTIDQVLSTRYFPPETHWRARGGVSDAQRAQYDPYISEALSGSNVSNWATGNASYDPRTGKRVGFAGGPRTASYGGEDFGIEGWTLPAIREAMEGGELTPIEGGSYGTRLAERYIGGLDRTAGPTVTSTTAPQDIPPPVTNRAGETFPTFALKGMGGGLADWFMTPGRAYQQGLTPEEEVNWGAGTALGMVGGRSPFIRPGELGAGGGRAVPSYRPGEPSGLSLEDTFNAPRAAPKLYPVEYNPYAWTGATPAPIHARAPEDFHAAIGEAKAAHPSGAAVTQYKPEEYAGMQTHTTADGMAGFALNGDDIVSVFKHPQSPMRNAAESMLSQAVQMGGRRLDAFDTVLPEIYGKGGFRAVARMPFDPKYAPEGWNYETFKRYNGGKPDVVFMVHDPYNPGYKAGDGVKVGSYDEAVALQKREADAVEKRKQAGIANFNEAANKITGLKGLGQYLTPPELERVTARNAQRLVDTFTQLPSGEEMAAVAFSGRAKRGWYKDSAQALIDIFGANDSRRFAGLLAALSPQSSVEMNALNALRTWNEWVKAGRPTNIGAINSAMDTAMGGRTSVMLAWRPNVIRMLRASDPSMVTLSGPKVNSFMENLRNNVHEVTNDTWMANYANMDQKEVAAARVVDPNAIPGYEPKIGVKSPGYLAFSAATRRAAQTLSQKTGQLWTPAEIQETIWSWAKTLYEKVSSANIDADAKKLLKIGGLSHGEIATTPDFARLFIGGAFRKVLEQGGYGEQIGRVEAGLGAGGARGRPAPAGSPLSAEGSGFTQPAFERYLGQAAERLDLRRAQGGQ